MSKHLKIAILLLVSSVAGCASLPSFSIDPLKPDQPEQVWQAKAVEFDRHAVDRTRLLSAVVVQAPDHWVRSERSGVVPVGVGTVKSVAVTRNAWRAIAFFPDGSDLQTSAIPSLNNVLIVLLPGVSEERARTAKIVILSGLSVFALDVSGKEYGNEPGFSMEKFLRDIRNSSLSIPFPNVVENLNPETPRGNLFLKGLYAMFSVEKIINGRYYLIAATAPEGLERATNGKLSPDDQIISNGTLFLAPGMGMPALAESVIRTMYNVGTAQPKGPYRASQFSSSSTPIPDPQWGKAGDR